MEDATNPEAPEVETLPVDAAEPDTTELDELGNPIEGDEPDTTEEAEDDSEEIDHDGQKFRIPKALKDSFLMHADYTRKTQTLAQEKQALEAERTQFQNLSSAEVNAQASVLAIDNALKEYQSIDWRAWFETNPQAAQAARLDLDELKERRQQALSNFGQARTTRQVQEQQEAARRVQQGQAELARDIPGWGPEKGAVLLDFGHKQFGFSRDELNAISDPRMIKVLNAAFEADKARTQQKTAKQIAAKQAIKPVPKVAGGTPPTKPLDDRNSTENWMKARREQVAKKQAAGR